MMGVVLLALVKKCGRKQKWRNVVQVREKKMGNSLSKKLVYPKLIN